MLYELTAVFAGGGIGAVLRYLMTLCAVKCFGMPCVGTFVVNIAGCFAIGYIFGLTLNKTALLPQHLKLFITVGFLGGLTTFSTFNYEVFSFFKDGKIIHGAGYMLLSCLLGLLFTLAGFLAANYRLSITS